MVYEGKSHLEMDDEQGYPHDYGNLHIITFLEIKIPIAVVEHHLLGS